LDAQLLIPEKSIWDLCSIQQGWDTANEEPFQHAKVILWMQFAGGHELLVEV